MTLTPQLLHDLRRALMKAHKHGQQTFVFMGQELSVKYAEYQIVYWESVLNKEEDQHEN